jgi:hypothetical protein
MENFLTEVAKQVPSLGVLCFIVWIFIKHLDKRAETLTEMHKEHLYAREQSREAVQDNTRAMQENSEVISELKSVIQNKLTSNGK